MKFVAVIVATLALALADEIPIDDCGSTATIQKIEFDQCSSLPCIIHKGETATGRATIVYNGPDVQSLECKITGMVGIIELPFNGCPNPACDNLSTGDCPVQDGETVVYDMSIPILDEYPSIEITGKWRLIDESGNDFICFKVPMKIE